MVERSKKRYLLVDGKKDKGAALPAALFDSL
jgi:hypothetical protein